MEPKDVVGVIVGIVVLVLFAGSFLWVVLGTEHEWQYSQAQQDANGRIFQIKRCGVCNKSKIRFISKFPLNLRK
jgi:hypothetical protein